MPRRASRNITGIRGTGAVSAGPVWRVFGCSNPGCPAVLRIEEAAFLQQSPDVTVTCSACQTTNNIGVINKGSRWKHCRVCEQLQPLDNFHKHSGMRSGKQLECKTCKNLGINRTLNPLRTSDQHREASDRRRVFGLIARDTRLSITEQRAVYKRFEHSCFNCGVSLKVGEGQLDHTLPARYLWSLRIGPTLLCSECNGRKAEQWPSEFYAAGGLPNREKLQELSYLTGIEYDLLAGQPLMDPDAVKTILLDVDGFLARWIRYPDQIRRLHRDLQQLAGVDLRTYASGVVTFLD